MRASFQLSDYQTAGFAQTNSRQAKENVAHTLKILYRPAK
jgi:hypothetical protein